jgi:hypothetical protein
MNEFERKVHLECLSKIATQNEEGSESRMMKALEYDSRRVRKVGILTRQVSIVDYTVQESQK